MKISQNSHKILRSILKVAKVLPGIYFTVEDTESIDKKNQGVSINVVGAGLDQVLTFGY